MAKRISLFEYKIVELENPDGTLGYMPQRGVPESNGVLVARFLWRDAVPAALPTFELALQFLPALQALDETESDGRTVSKKSDCRK